MYPPLDTLKPVADNLSIVDSGPLGSWMRLPIRMTVIRLSSGALWLHSPTRLTPGLRSEIDALGAVGNLVAPNSAHWMHLEAWQRGYLNATTWAAPGLRDRKAVKDAGVRLDSDLSDTPPDAWTDEIDQIVVPGGAGFREVAFLHRPSRTLVPIPFRSDSFGPGQLVAHRSRFSPALHTDVLACRKHSKASAGGTSK